MRRAAAYTLSGTVGPIAAILLLAASAGEAALTTDTCLAKKRQAWITLRKCQATADLKRLQGKPADLVKCQTQFQEKLAKIGAKAAEAAIDCRYGDNGDETVTDYDTGLMWEKKDGTFGGPCSVLPTQVSHCVNSQFHWDTAQAYVAGTSADDFVVTRFLAGYSDWRLPTISELRGILRNSCPPQPAGQTPLPCIDPIFGPTAPSTHFSSTTPDGQPIAVWCLSFNDAQVNRCAKDGEFYVRAVRGGL